MHMCCLLHAMMSLTSRWSLNAGVAVWLHAVPARLADECVPCVML